MQSLINEDNTGQIEIKKNLAINEGLVKNFENANELVPEINLHSQDEEEQARSTRMFRK